MAGDNGGKLGFLIFYVAFYLLITFIAADASADPSSGVGIGITGNIVAPPQLAAPSPSDYSGGVLGNLGNAIGNVIDFLIYIISYLVYFFGLQGLTLFGMESGIAALISLPLTIGFVYVMVTLIRGS
jgi:hypothetical protein